LAQVVGGGGPATLDLATGRAAALYAGDRLIVVLGRFVSPIAISAELPPGWGEAVLAHRCGIAGVPSAPAFRGEPPLSLQLLGALVDHDGQGIELQSLCPPMNHGTRPLHSIGVVSAARGTRASVVAAALVRGFHRTGLNTATIKPIGVPCAVERWGFRDSGATRALDLIDVGHLCADGLATDQIAEMSRRLLGDVTSNGAEAAVLRIAGGIATREVAGLLDTHALHGLVDGVVLAATDALSAIEGARRLRESGVRLLAVSGAIVRSPLACREAARELPVPVISTEELARPACLQRLLVGSPISPELALAA
jgi:hypothetical protein